MSIVLSARQSSRVHKIADICGRHITEVAFVNLVQTLSLWRLNALSEHTADG